MHPFCRAQIALLIANKSPGEVPKNYAEYFNISSKETITKLSKYIGINNYLIDLKEKKQPFSRPIYSLGQVLFEMLKTYIKDNLKNIFIRPSKSLAIVFILFVENINGLI